MAKISTYKALFISDIHMSNRLPYAVPANNGMTDRLEEQVKLWEHVSKTIVNKQINDVYILGDLVDKALVDPVTLFTTVECVSNLPAKVYVLAGNHDSNSTRGGRFFTEVFGAMGKHNLISLPQFGVQKVKDWLDFTSMGYCSKEQAEKQLSKARARIGASLTDKIDVLLMHHSVNGCEHQGWVCDDGLDADEVCESFDLVLSGHFHESQRFGPDLQGMYLGAPMHHRFDDVGRDAGYWIVTFKSNGKHTFEYIDPGLAKFWMLKDVEEDVPAKSSRSRRDFVRWRIRASKEDWESELKKKTMAKVGAALALGYRADFVFKPISKATERLTGDEVLADGETKKPKPLEEQMVDFVSYLNPDFNHKKLLEIGYEIMREAAIAK